MMALVRLRVAQDAHGLLQQIMMRQRFGMMAHANGPMVHHALKTLTQMAK